MRSLSCMCCETALLPLPPGSFWHYLLAIRHFFRHRSCLGSRDFYGNQSFVCCSGSHAGGFGAPAMTVCSTTSSPLLIA
ncbi:hypothetical protein LINPERHAP1_LOCUS26769 [Linum perenne]